MKKILSSFWMYLMLLLLVGAMVGWQQQPGQRQNKPPRTDSINANAGKKADFKEQEMIIRWVKNYRQNYKDSTKYSRSFFFSKKILEDITKGKSAGVRIYQGLDDNGVIQAVIIGTNKDGKDLFDPNAAVAESNAFIGLTLEKCPNNCDGFSPLRN